MTLPCEFCGRPVCWDDGLGAAGVPPCCHDCRWIPALLSVCAIALLSGVIYLVVRSLYG